MNHIYRIVYNQATGTYQAVAEFVKNRTVLGGGGEKSRSAVRISRNNLLNQASLGTFSKIKILSALIMALSGSLAWAAPQGGKVVAGQANISHNGKITNINQSSQRAAINWQKFGVKADETVNFKQPNAQSITLNRVIGNEKSVINGAMNANGKVFLVNPHGTIIGKNAKINVGGLVASTADISNDDFMKGNYRFKGKGLGEIENLGEITVPEGGVVALIAPIVKNKGKIKAEKASVLLASAQNFSITLPENEDFAYTIDKGTLEGLIDNGGAILADGGLVVLTAEGIDAVKKSVIRHSGLIQANTVLEKDGKILLLGDQSNSKLELTGTLKAEAPVFGNGGFIETSASEVKIADTAKVSTKAKNGKTGEWLIDPADFTIASSGGDITGSAVSNALKDNNFTIYSNGKIVRSNDKIFVITGRDEDRNGSNINVNDTINWSANTLTLNADNNIYFNTTISATGTGKLDLRYGQATNDGGDSNYYLAKDVRINLPEGQNFSTKKGKSGEKVDFNVIHKMPELLSSAFDSSEYFSGFPNGNTAIGKDIDLSYTQNYQGFRGWYTYEHTHRISGLGHHLSNLHINTVDPNSPIGFINSTNKKLEIDNIHLRNIDISSLGKSPYVGGLIGLTDGDTNASVNIRNSSITGKISLPSSWSDDYYYNIIGGLIGGANAATITNSYADVAINSDGTDVGGLVGASSRSKIKNSYATGDVKGSSVVGGLVGWSNSTTISDSYSTGDVKGNTATGGLVGSLSNSTISNSYATGNVSSSSGDGGGLVGLTAPSTNSRISHSYATGNVSGYYGLGGLIGRNKAQKLTIENSYALFDELKGSHQLGGLIGASNPADIEIKNSFARGRITETDTREDEIKNRIDEFVKENGRQPSYDEYESFLKNGYIGGAIGGLFGDSGTVSLENVYFSGQIYNGDYSKHIDGVIGSEDIQDRRINWSNDDITLKNVYIHNIDGDDNDVGSFAGGNLIGLSTSQMKDKNSFQGFDFNNTWELTNGKYPTLKAFNNNQGNDGKIVLKLKVVDVQTPYTGNNNFLTYDNYIAGGQAAYTLVSADGSTVPSDIFTGAITFGGDWSNAINVKGEGKGYTVIPQYTIADKYKDKYVIEVENGTFTITPKMVSVSGSKIYDGTSSFRISTPIQLKDEQVLPQDKGKGLYVYTPEGYSLNLGIYDTNQNFKPAGKGNVLSTAPYSIKGTATVYNKDGTVNHNYYVGGMESKFKVEPRPLTVVITVEEKYINSVSATNAKKISFDGKVASDTITLKENGKAVIDKNGKVISNTFTITGQNPQNYKVSYRFIVTNPKLSPDDITKHMHGSSKPATTSANAVSLNNQKPQTPTNNSNLNNNQQTATLQNQNVNNVIVSYTKAQDNQTNTTNNKENTADDNLVKNEVVYATPEKTKSAEDYISELKNKYTNHAWINGGMSKQELTDMANGAISLAKQENIDVMDLLDSIFQGYSIYGSYIAMPQKVATYTKNIHKGLTVKGNRAVEYDMKDIVETHIKYDMVTDYYKKNVDFFNIVDEYKGVLNNESLEWFSKQEQLDLDKMVETNKKRGIVSTFIDSMVEAVDGIGKPVVSGIWNVATSVPDNIADLAEAFFSGVDLADKAYPVAEAMYHAVLCIKNGELEEMGKFIKSVKDYLGKELSFVGPFFDAIETAYNSFYTMQQSFDTVSNLPVIVGGEYAISIDAKNDFTMIYGQEIARQKSHLLMAVYECIEKLASLFPAYTAYAQLSEAVTVAYDELLNNMILKDDYHNDLVELHEKKAKQYDILVNSNQRNAIKMRNILMELGGDGIACCCPKCGQLIR